jgi:spermidine dehydrogenase
MAPKKLSELTDRELGMDRPIARRDFLNGAAIAVGSAVLPGLLPGLAFGAEAAPQDKPGYYPPRLTGLRGSHPGSFEDAHKLRDGDLKLPESIPASGESYDLVIVGGGISGLSAAHFYAHAHPNARILILDNHDDFGGHAKRNEFDLAGRLHLMNGGTYAIESPRPYSPVSEALIRRLGIDPEAFETKYHDKTFYKSQGLTRSIFFDRETFGADYLMPEAEDQPWADRLAHAPLSDKVRQDLIRLNEAKIDYMPGLSSAEKKAKLARMSYKAFLLDVVKVDPLVAAIYQTRTHGEWGVGIDAVGALEVWAFEFPGFQGMGLEPGASPDMGYTAGGYAEGGSAYFHFPDGNATIARLLVRNLIPDAIPGHSAEDIVTAKADYAKLDRPQNKVRIRLSSIVVRARHLGDPESANEVEIVYLRGGVPASVRAKACVLACWNAVIPYLCPELPERQKTALHEAVKTPLVYTSVALSNWRAFKKLGIEEIYAPNGYHYTIRLNHKVDIGAYKSVRSPDEPILLWMVRTPCQPGLSEKDQNRAGRAELLATPFETFEREIRQQLARTLGPGGFDPATDITAITVNRWPHGYAYEYNPLFDPNWDEPDLPHVVGRQRFGRITIANSDAGAAAYTDSAIDQAWRAVGELLATEA